MILYRCTRKCNFLLDLFWAIVFVITVPFILVGGVLFILFDCVVALIQD